MTFDEWLGEGCTMPDYVRQQCHEAWDRAASYAKAASAARYAPMDAACQDIAVSDRCGRAAADKFYDALNKVLADETKEVRQEDAT